MKDGITRIFVASLLLIFCTLDFGCSNYNCPELNELDVYDYSQLKSVVVDYNMAYGKPPESIDELRKFIENDAKDLGYQNTMTEVLGCGGYSINLVNTDLMLYYKDSLFIEMPVIYGDVLYGGGKINTENSLKNLLTEIKKDVIDSISSQRKSYDVFYHQEDLTKNVEHRVLLTKQSMDKEFTVEDNFNIEMLKPFLNILNSSDQFASIDSIDLVIYLPDTVLNRPPPPPL